ncbi:MAG: tetratricopeptide repeat protein [Pseudomonadota bacterium]
MSEIATHFYAGILALQSENLSQAEKNFQFILNINPDHVPTLINLGALELKRGAGQMAIAYFTQVLILDENNVMARQNLAATFMHYDRFENAMTHYEELKKQNCLETEDFYNMGVASAALGQLSVAKDYYQQVLALDETHNAALNNLAALHIRLGQRSDAIDLLQRALQVKPQDSASQFMLDVLTNNKQNPMASQDYVRNLFNNYALYYEQHLQKILKYSLPEQALTVLHELQFNQFKTVLDLGCGTGLSGIALRACSQHLIGVDLSKKMLSQAHDKHIYDDLIEADIVSFLSDDSHNYDLIQALDVLPYFGELENLVNKIIPRLTTQGILLFSAEISEDQPWQIQDSMRFCHDPNYIRSILEGHGLKELYRSRVIARQENEQNLYAILLAYQK